MTDFETSYWCKENVFPVPLVELVSVLFVIAFVADWLKQLQLRNHWVDVFGIRGKDTNENCHQAP